MRRSRSFWLAFGLMLALLIPLYPARAASAEPAAPHAAPSSTARGVYAVADFLPTSINDAGQVIGYAWFGRNEQRAVLWSHATMLALRTAGGGSSIPIAINASGQVVGWHETADGKERAVLWDHGQTSELGVNLGVGEPGPPIAINSHGQVAGAASDRDSAVFTSGITYAFTSVNGILVRLKTLGGIRAPPVRSMTAGRSPAWQPLRMAHITWCDGSRTAA